MRSRTGWPARPSRCRPSRRSCPGRTPARSGSTSTGSTTRTTPHPGDRALPRRHRRSDPTPGEDALVVDARNTGRARVDDVAGGAADPRAGLARRQLRPALADPGDPGRGRRARASRPVVGAPGVCWPCSALALLAGSLVVVDRLGRSFVRADPPSSPSARQTLGTPGRRRAPVAAIDGPAGGAGARRRRRTASSAGSSCCSTRERAERRRPLPPPAHARHRAAAARRGRRRPGRARAASPATSTRCRPPSTTIVREARRSEREGLDPRTDAVAVVAERVRHWEPLAEDQGRAYDLRRCRRPGRCRCGPAAPTWRRWSTCCSTTSSPTPPTTPPYASRWPPPTTGSSWSSRTPVPACPDGLDATGRGESGSGSTGLGLSIAARTAEDSGGAIDHGCLGHGRSPGRRHVADGLTRAPAGDRGSGHGDLHRAGAAAGRGHRELEGVLARGVAGGTCRGRARPRRRPRGCGRPRPCRCGGRRPSTSLTARRSRCRRRPRSRRARGRR